MKGATCSGALRARALWRLGDQAGVSLVEILIAGLVVGVAVIGLALMFSRGNTYVFATGDDRIALGLAEQKIEQIRAAGFGVANPGVVVTEPVTTEMVPTGTATKKRSFTRVTCIQYVDPANITSPAYASDCPAGAVTLTKRITVIVTPDQPEANPVSLQAWIP
ncbi:MAG: type IV pilus modification PilV family protein [Candidatus Methylomirabilis sp.]